ncbi:uncharacterized protein WM294_004432 [Sarcoramphus papa]
MRWCKHLAMLNRFPPQPSFACRWLRRLTVRGRPCVWRLPALSAAGAPQLFQIMCCRSSQADGQLESGPGDCSESWWRGSRKRGRRWMPPPLWGPGGLPTPGKRRRVPPARQGQSLQRGGIPPNRP